MVCVMSSLGDVSDYLKMVTSGGGGGGAGLWRPLELRDSPPSPSPPPAPRARVMTRAGLPAGWCSRDFSTKELLAYTCPSQPTEVWVEEDGAGGAVAASARLAGSVPGAALRLEAAGGGGWRVRCVLPAPPRAELRLWLHPELLALLRVPHLAPIHIRGESRYQCARCGRAYADPNPLKLHLWARCGPSAGAEATLWARLAAARLAASPAEAERLAALLGARAGAGGGHRCVYCGRVYSRRYGLRIHVRTHTGWRPLRCAVCRRAFADPSNLNKHAKLHRLRGDPAPTPSPSPPTNAPHLPTC